jgi:hypothetical protein
MTRAKNITGERFGRLVVLEQIAPTVEVKKTRVRCLCDCGKETVVNHWCVMSGHTVSCGCAKGQLFKVSHGKRDSRTYNIWCHMKARCVRETHQDFKHYGARGITVCDRWQTFENFLEDMGEAPEGFSIERKDVNGNYEPSNCEWLLATEQPRNTRRTRYAILNGERMIFSDVARALGVSTSMPSNWYTGKRRIPDGLDLVFE